MQKGNGMKNSITALGIAFTVALPRPAQAQSVTPPPVPANIRVPAPNEAFLLGRATGTQNYVCQPANSLGRVAWTLFTPQATLFGDLDEQLTTHFFGPNPFEGGVVVRAAWQDSRDTSTFWGRAVASSLDPDFVSPNAIPWVLLERAGAQAGPTGGDTLAKTTFVHRVNTEGGVAPSTGCALLRDVGRKAFVPYTADYFFYKDPTR
jgi:Protein of unknown function (DUF3455)